MFFLGTLACQDSDTTDIFDSLPKEECFSKKKVTIEIPERGVMQVTFIESEFGNRIFSEVKVTSGQRCFHQQN